MKFYKKIEKATLIGMVLLLLSACAKPTEEPVVVGIDPLCGVLSRPFDDHMNSIIDNGQGLLKIGADEVIVTATEVSDVFQTVCK